MITTVVLFSEQTKCGIIRTVETRLHDLQYGSKTFKHSRQSSTRSSAGEKGGVGSQVSL